MIASLEGVLVGIGIPLILVAGILPAVWLSWRARSVREELSPEVREKYDLIDRGAVFGVWDFFFLGLLLLLYIKPEFLGHHEGVLTSLLFLCVAVFSISRALKFSGIVRGRGELPDAVVRYAVYGLVGMGILAIVCAAGSIWEFRAYLGSR